MALKLHLTSRYGLSAFGSIKVAADIVKSFPLLPSGQGQIDPQLL